MLSWRWAGDAEHDPGEGTEEGTRAELRPMSHRRKQQEGHTPAREAWV